MINSFFPFSNALKITNYCSFDFFPFLPVSKNVFVDDLSVEEL